MMERTRPTAGDANGDAAEVSFRIIAPLVFQRLEPIGHPDVGTLGHADIIAKASLIIALP